MVLSFLFSLVVGAYYDSQGVRYNNEMMEKLELASSTIEEYQIPANTRIIGGGTQESYSAFSQCRKTLKKLTFSSESNLSEIEQCGFYGLEKITELDMSMCLKIEAFPIAAFSNCISIKSFIF